MSLETIIHDAIPGVILGACVGGAVAALKSTVFTQPQSAGNWTRKLLFQPEAFDIDYDCAEMFLKLQKFRLLAPNEFDEAGWDADSLFCLEKQLLRREITFDESMPRTALRYIRQMSNHLEMFLEIAKWQLYTERTMHNRPATEIEQGKNLVREVNLLIKDIQKCVGRHIPRISAWSVVSR